MQTIIAYPTFPTDGNLTIHIHTRHHFIKCVICTQIHHPCIIYRDTKMLYDRVLYKTYVIAYSRFDSFLLLRFWFTVRFLIQCPIFEFFSRKFCIYKVVQMSGTQSAISLLYGNLICWGWDYCKLEWFSGCANRGKIKNNSWLFCLFTE